MTMATGILIAAVILTLAALPVVHRIIAGPTILDRAVGADMLVVLVVMGFGLYCAQTRSVYAEAAMLSLTALAFLSTVAIARFVAREDVQPGRGGPDERTEDAEEHEALHDAGSAVQDTAAHEAGPGVHHHAGDDATGGR